MATLTQKSQVTIPKNIRQVLGIGPGDDVEFDIDSDQIILHKKKKPDVVDKYRGLLGKKRTAEVMAELR